MIITLLLCGRSISQIDTNQKVIISRAIADSIGKDLLRGDICKQEIKIVRDNLKLTEEKVTLKDEIINQLKFKIIDLDSINKKQAEISSKQEQISKTFEKQLKSQKITSNIYKIFTILSVGYLLIHR